MCPIIKTGTIPCFRVEVWDDSYSYKTESSELHYSVWGSLQINTEQ
ncbi:hypothetical protein ADICYQ_2768 [Cyclobacterium qasimii M12-11B]|uniref:Uncharacterized protein n=1 Tax=Cyclobacterium qasimii M12-11B TaxID=641524 RepID=S7WWA8_9BACT|nr:hypothetical protein ADICYQ_2768 [Cyclobacterium qasimii M12-11B]